MPSSVKRKKDFQELEELFKGSFFNPVWKTNNAPHGVRIERVL